jgi:hypothetical protein
MATTEPVRFYLRVPADVSVEDPRIWNEVWPRCPYCGKQAYKEVVRVNGHTWHAACWDHLEAMRP